MSVLEVLNSGVGLAVLGLLIHVHFSLGELKGRLDEHLAAHAQEADKQSQG